MKSGVFCLLMSEIDKMRMTWDFRWSGRSDHEMISGVGVDILHLPRLHKIVERYGAEKLARRILNPREMTVWQAGAENDRLSRLALR